METKKKIEEQLIKADELGFYEDYQLTLDLPIEEDQETTNETVYNRALIKEKLTARFWDVHRGPTQCVDGFFGDRDKPDGLILITEFDMAMDDDCELDFDTKWNKLGAVICTESIHLAKDFVSSLNEIVRAIGYNVSESQNARGLSGLHSRYAQYSRKADRNQVPLDLTRVRDRETGRFEGVFSNFTNDYARLLDNDIKGGMPMWFNDHDVECLLNPAEGGLNDLPSAAEIYYENMIKNSLNSDIIPAWMMFSPELFMSCVTADDFSGIAEFDAKDDTLAGSFGEINPQLAGREDFPFYWTTRPWEYHFVRSEEDEDGNWFTVEDRIIIDHMGMFNALLGIGSRRLLKCGGTYHIDRSTPIWKGVHTAWEQRSYWSSRRETHLVIEDDRPPTELPEIPEEDWWTRVYGERELNPDLAADFVVIVGGLNNGFRSLFSRYARKMRGSRDIEYPLSVKALSPNRALEHSCFLKRVSLDEPTTATLNWRPSDSALETVLAPSNLLGTIARDIYYSHEVHAIHAVEMKKRSKPGQNSRAPKTQLLPIFYGKVRADLYYNQNGAHSRLWQRGTMLYPWLHQSREDHDVPSASYGMGRFNVTDSGGKFSVSLDVIHGSVSELAEIERQIGRAECYPSRANEILIDQCNYAQIIYDAYIDAVQSTLSGVLKATVDSGKANAVGIEIEQVGKHIRIKMSVTLLELFRKRIEDTVDSALCFNYPNMSETVRGLWTNVVVKHFISSQDFENAKMSFDVILNKHDVELTHSIKGELKTILLDYVMDLGMRVYIVHRHDSEKVREFKLPYLRRRHLTGGE